MCQTSEESQLFLSSSVTNQGPWTLININWGQVRNSGGEGNGTPLQHSCLENPMDGGAWWAVVHGVAKSWTQLSDFTFTFHFHALEKEMATHSGVLAWRIPGTGEPGGLLSMGSRRAGHDWSDLAAAARNSGKALLGLILQQEGVKTSNRCPACLWAKGVAYVVCLPH